MFSYRINREVLKRAMIKKLILVFKTHFDIGFTDLASNVVRQYAEGMLDQVLETCRATEPMGDQKYVWTMPAWPLYVVDRMCDPTRRSQLEHYIQNGQIAWHALAFTSHTDFCGQEEYLESLRYSKRLCEKYGKPYSIAAKMTDVPGHGRMLPEILGASGVKFLHLGCNAFATPPDVPLLFHWEAPSGRRVLTMYSKGGYGSGLQAPDGWPFPVWMALMNTQDNCGPQSAEVLHGLIAKARSLYPEAEIRCGTMDDFAAEMAQCDLSGIPVVTADLADTWIHGVGAYPKETGTIRALRRAGAGLQKYAAQRAIAAGDPAAFPDLDAYYENMHLFGEHTWGADVKTWLGPDRVYEKASFLGAKSQKNYQFMEESWQEQRQRAQDCDTELARLRFGSGEGYVYNPSAVSFQGWAPCRRGKETIFGYPAGFVDGLPPFSSLPEADMETPDAPDLTLHHSPDGAYVENHRYRLDFHPQTGEILRLSDRKSGRLLLKQRDGISPFSYRYHRYGVERMTEFLRAYGYRFPAWGVQDYGRENYPECADETCAPVFEGFRIHGSSIVFSYRGGSGAEAYGDARRVEVELTLPSLGEELFAELRLSDKQETPFIESGCFSLPLAADDPQYLINKNGSLLDPAQDIAKNANHVYYALEHMTAARQGNVGLLVLPLDTPLLSLGEDGCYRYRRQYEKSAPILCFNLFNNMWGTNFPQWTGGSFSFRYVLRSYEAEEEAGLLEKAGMLAQGLLRVGSPVPPLPLSLPKGMELLNLRPEGNGYLLVTRDASGTESLEALEFPGFLLREGDYFGRSSGEFRENQLEFFRRKYGLHLFYAQSKASELI